MGQTALLPDFFARKNPTASAGFQPANSGTRGQHANHTKHSCGCCSVGTMERVVFRKLQNNTRILAHVGDTTARNPPGGRHNYGLCYMQHVYLGY
jgi:hypothetical protein